MNVELPNYDETRLLNGRLPFECLVLLSSLKLPIELNPHNASNACSTTVDLSVWKLGTSKIEEY